MFDIVYPSVYLASRMGRKCIDLWQSPSFQANGLLSKGDEVRKDLFKRCAEQSTD